VIAVWDFVMIPMSKRLLVLLMLLILAAVHTVEAQQSMKIPRIGYLATRNIPTSTTPDPAADAFQQGLRELGYVQGKNILVEYRYAGGTSEDRIQGLVAEIMQLKVDVLISPATSVIRAAKQATKVIPIVMVITADPVETGLVASLARPGGNVTGVTRLTHELSGKRLELLKEMIPKLSRVGLLLDADAAGFKDYEIAASALNLKLQSLRIRSPNLDFEGAFKAGAKGRVSAIVTVSGGLTVGHRNRIAELAIINRLASMHERNEFVEAGGLMSYSSIDSESFRRAAYYVDRILKGAKPADLPVEQPTKFELVINLKTAKQIGVTIPPNVLARADRVIRDR
jgi:putative tryptophan/tyrosine transport system substrate-binding protein